MAILTWIWLLHALLAAGAPGLPQRLQTPLRFDEPVQDDNEYFIPSGPMLTDASCNAAAFAYVLPPGGRIERAELVTSGKYGEGFPNLGHPNPAVSIPPNTCAVTVCVSSCIFSCLCPGSYRFGLLLPPKSIWEPKKRFLTVGNYAFGGGINWPDMTTGPARGMAAMSTDTGHNSVGNDMRWAFNNIRLRSSWGWSAMNGSVHNAKALIQHYYGQNISHSYYAGCSTGGRQGLKQIQLDPYSFDGLLIGAPAWDTKRHMPWLTKVGLANLPKGGEQGLQVREWKILTKKARAVCDGQDGVKDNIISVESCKLNDTHLDDLECRPGGCPECLTKAQITAAKAIYRNYEFNTTFVYNAPNPGSEADFIFSLPYSRTFDQDWQRFWLYNDPLYGASSQDSYDDEDVLRLSADKVITGEATADQYAIPAFRAHRGKIILYHGLADGVVPTGASTRYYSKTREAMNETLEEQHEWFRYFQIPGAYHTGVSESFLADGLKVDPSNPSNAPWMIGTPSQAAYLYQKFKSINPTLTGFGVPGQQNSTSHDALLALIDWVEERKAVDSLVATTWTPKYSLTRRLCPYPKVSVLKTARKDDTTMWNAENWECRDEPLPALRGNDAFCESAESEERVSGDEYDHGAENNDDQDGDDAETGLLSSLVNLAWDLFAFWEWDWRSILQGEAL